MVNDLTCPKCQGAMRSYERNGVNIEQCADCRGIFLDRGELEQLLDAEATYNQATPPAARAPQQGYGYDGGHHGSGHDRPGSGGHQKRRKGFLGELFD
jgi:Uncharacterized protein conserved in bacteria